ncbi:hypothetical protein ROZALSC1DRAFT_28830, partial [Rozella allomycis CSF55]
QHLAASDGQTLSVGLQRRRSTKVDSSISEKPEVVLTKSTHSSLNDDFNKLKRQMVDFFVSLQQKPGLISHLNQIDFIKMLEEKFVSEEFRDEKFLAHVLAEIDAIQISSDSQQMKNELGYSTSKENIQKMSIPASFGKPPYKVISKSLKEALLPQVSNQSFLSVGTQTSKKLDVDIALLQATFNTKFRSMERSGDQIKY